MIRFRAVLASFATVKSGMLARISTNLKCPCKLIGIEFVWVEADFAMQETAAELALPSQLLEATASLSDAPPLSAPDLTESIAAIQNQLPEVAAAQAVVQEVDEAMLQTAQPANAPISIPEPAVTQIAQVKLAQI